MKLLLNTYCKADLDCCNWAYLEITPELAAAILRRRTILQSAHRLDSSCVSMDFYDSSVTFLDGIPESLGADPEAAGLVDSGPFAEISASAADFENFAARTDCDRMVVGSDGVYWSCYPKHADHTVETREIDYKTIEKCVPLEVL